MRKAMHAATDDTELASAREQLIELSLDMLCVFDRDGSFKVLNPAWTATLGWSQTELRARPMIEFVHPDDRAHATHTLTELAAGKSIRDQVYRLYCKDGSFCWVSANASPGTAGLTVAVVRDITHQQATATALRKHAQELQLLVDNIPGLISRVDRDLRYLFANQEFDRVFGWAAEDVIGHTMPEVLGADMFARIEPYVQSALAGNAAEFEFTITHADSGVLHRLVRIVPELTPDGTVKGFLVAGFDMTAQKRLNALLTLQAAVLHKIALNTPSADTLDTLLKMTEEQGKDMLCSILLLDANGIHLRCAAAPSIPKGFMDVYDNRPIGPSSGSCGTAAYRRETVVVEDIASDPLWRDHRDVALAHGLRACWSAPIFGTGHKVLGTIAIYYRISRRPLPEERQLIEMVAALAAIAITRQQEEGRLRTIEQRLHHIGTNLPDTVLYQLLCEADGRRQFVYVSSAIERVMGITADAVLADSSALYAQILAEDAGLLVAAEAESLRTMSAFQLHIRMWIGAGGVRWMKLRSAPRKLGDGRIVWDGVISDITELKAAEQALYDSRERLSRIIKATPGGVVTVDADGFFLFANQEAERLLGLSAKDPAARAYDDPPWLLRNLDGTPVAGCEMPCQRAFDTNQSVYGVERTVVHADGTQFLLSINASPLRDVSGAVTEVVATLSDITAARSTELALRTHQTRLQVLSQRLLEVQETERATLARELHDDIGQTLTALKLNLQWVQPRVTGTALKKVTAAVELTGHALAQTRSLTLDLRPPQLDTLGLAAALRDQAKRIAASAGLAVRFVIEPECGTAKSPQAVALFRIAQEALTNIARHAGAREVVVELRQQEGELLIAISDDGRGFDLVAERDRALKGGSMGLLGMEERAVLAGGRLQIDTRPGQGTRVQASYPLKAGKKVRKGAA